MHSMSHTSRQAPSERERERETDREREREREIASAKALGGGAKQGVGDFCPPGQKGKFLVQKFVPIGRTFVSN